MNTPFYYSELLKNEFLGASDRAAAIVGGAFVDEILTELLKGFLVTDVASDNKLFSGSGPFATFSSKIDVAYRMGLISKSEHGCIHTIRSIRNVFAHQMDGALFTAQSIKDKCLNISVPREMLVPDFSPPLTDEKKQATKPPVKVDENDARAVFQEAISHVMRILAARIVQAKKQKRNTPINFSAAHEPILTILEKMKELERNALEALEVAKALGSSEVKSVKKNIDEYHLIVQKTELFVEQIKAAHLK